MLPLDLAMALRDAGVVWRPASGDAFRVPGRDLDDQVFVLSDMVIETVEVAGGPTILAFNGTTEWALDSLEADEAVWVPREDQLRILVGDAFVSLERTGRDPDGYVVTVFDPDPGTEPGAQLRHVDVSAEAAYARALLEIRGRRVTP